MSHKGALRCLDRLLREIMGLPNVPFGGKLILCGGDFRYVNVKTCLLLVIYSPFCLQSMSACNCSRWEGSYNQSMCQNV